MGLSLLIVISALRMACPPTTPPPTSPFCPTLIGLHSFSDAEPPAHCPSPTEFHPPAPQFSAYTASRMNTWTEKGRANVKLMLAKMSIPPEQSNANFSEHREEERERGWGAGEHIGRFNAWLSGGLYYASSCPSPPLSLCPSFPIFLPLSSPPLPEVMKPHLRDSLPKQLQTHGPSFGLNMRMLMAESFEVRFKSCVRLSATDMVSMITMALGRPRENAEEAKMGFQ